MAKAKSASKKPAPKKAKKPSSRKRAVAPTQEETVEVAVGSLLIGDNLPPVRDLKYHYSNILGLMDKARTAAGKVGEAKKAAKEAGVDVSALMTVMKLERLDPLELATMLQQQATMMTNLGLPVQLQLWEPSFGSIDERAKAEGWAAGKAARSMDTVRWPEGAPGHEAYTRSWNDAQRDNVVGGGKSNDQGDNDSDNDSE